MRRVPSQLLLGFAAAMRDCGAVRFVAVLCRGRCGLHGCTAVCCSRLSATVPAFLFWILCFDCLFVLLTREKVLFVNSEYVPFVVLVRPPGKKLSRKVLLKSQKSDRKKRNKYSYEYLDLTNESFNTDLYK